MNKIKVNKKISKRLEVLCTVSGADPEKLRRGCKSVFWPKNVLAKTKNVSCVDIF